MPSVVEPMLLKIAHEVPRGPRWAFEAKYDGYRAIVYLSGGRVRIQSRSLRDMTSHDPELFALGRAYSGRELILDGEVVAFEADGKALFPESAGARGTNRVWLPGLTDGRSHFLRGLRCAVCRRPANNDAAL
jgi:ATP-dependent DNA ligase